MKHALILHGTAASPDANWFRWLEQVLIMNSYDVWVPQLPGCERPNAKTYNDFLLSNTFTYNSDSILVGHSSGAVEILNLLQSLPDDTNVGDVYLVSVFKDDLGWDILKELFNEPFDFQRIKSKVRSITIIHSDTDPHVPEEQARFIAHQLDARFVMIPNQGHFNTLQSEEYVKFPLLAQLIETNSILDSEEQLSTFRGMPVSFQDIQDVTQGVRCDVYSFKNDTSKDLGIIHIKKGASTPHQKIVDGDATIEGCLKGSATLAISRTNSEPETLEYTDNSYGLDTSLGKEDSMRWTAVEDALCFEMCYPPYQDGRFITLKLIS